MSVSMKTKLSIVIFFIISNVYSQGSTNGSVKTYYTTLYDKGVKFYEGNVLEQDEELRSGNSTVKVKNIYKHGQGTSFLNNSTNAYRKGNFYYDNLNGHGEMHVGAIHYVGNWKDNKKNGIGKEWSDGSDGRAKFVYEGGFVNDRYNGKGKFVTDNFTFEGGYSNHNFSGQGKITYSDGGTYSGMFSNGLRNGYGEFYYANGDVYRGNWLNNNRHGEAEYFFSNTKKTERLVFENNIQKSAMVAEDKQVNSQSSGTATNQTTSLLDKKPGQSGSTPNANVNPVQLESVVIGTQTWSKKSLNVSHFRNGDQISEAKSWDEWEMAYKNKQPVWSCYKFIASNCEKYGKIYNWYAIADSRGLAPIGWHIPTKLEWEVLIKYAGGDDLENQENTAKKLKSTSGWNNVSFGGTSIEKCPNCEHWNSEYRRKVPCHVCQDNRQVKVVTPVVNYSGNGTNAIGFSALQGGGNVGWGLDFMVQFWAFPKAPEHYFDGKKNNGYNAWSMSISNGRGSKRPRGKNDEVHYVHMIERDLDDSAYVRVIKD